MVHYIHVAYQNYQKNILLTNIFSFEKYYKNWYWCHPKFINNIALWQCYWKAFGPFRTFPEEVTPFIAFDNLLLKLFLNLLDRAAKWHFVTLKKRILKIIDKRKFIKICIQSICYCNCCHKWCHPKFINNIVKWQCYWKAFGPFRIHGILRWLHPLPFKNFLICNLLLLLNLFYGCCQVAIFFRRK